MTLSLEKKCLCEGRNPACSECVGFGYLPVDEPKTMANPKGYKKNKSKIELCNICKLYVKNLDNHKRKIHEIKNE